MFQFRNTNVSLHIKHLQCSRLRLTYIFYLNQKFYKQSREFKNVKFS